MQICRREVNLLLSPIIRDPHERREFASVAVAHRLLILFVTMRARGEEPTAEQPRGHTTSRVEKRDPRRRRASRPRVAEASTSETERRPEPAENVIMVIEDDVDLRDGIAYLLEACGYEVIAAEDGEDALQRLRRGAHPCLILLDLNMPRKDGFQFRREQMQDPTLETIPTIAYSGIYTGTGLREKAAALGISTVLEKPVDYDALLDLVERYCVRQDG